MFKKSLRFAFLLSLGCVFAEKVCVAGLSPENVVVVVNAEDPQSVRIADVYMQLRNIPPSHRIDLTGVSDKNRISLAEFRDTILTPVLTAMDQSSLAGTVQCVAYSSGFPTGVDVKPHYDRFTGGIRKYNRGVASITGLTYLYQFVLADSPEYLDVVSNYYARGAFSRHFKNPFLETSKRQRFEEIRRLRNDPATAAERYDEMYAANPTLVPLAILAAQKHAEADNVDAVQPRLKLAVAAGWRSRQYIGGDDQLERHLLPSDASRLIDFPLVAQEPVPFDSRMSYGISGWPMERPGQPAKGVRYLMSVMLAVVHPLGLTADESIEVLQRAAKSEAQPPRGQFWFSTNADVRAKTRLPAVPGALTWLEWLGEKASIQPGSMPLRPGVAMGMMLGTATMNFDYKPWEFSTGAMAETLTSSSGNYETKAQTKITELLRNGAAITCGVVTEPFTIVQKFPSPMTYAYYATGASAIESMYLGLANPYQQLIVGDPLCQPFAKPPRHRLAINVVEDLCQVQVFSPQDFVESETKLSRIDLVIDGVLKKSLPPRARFEMRLPPGTDVQSRLRVVLVGDDMMRSRRTVIPGA